MRARERQRVPASTGNLVVGSGGDRHPAIRGSGRRFLLWWDSRHAGDGCAAEARSKADTRSVSS